MNQLIIQFLLALFKQIGPQIGTLLQPIFNSPVYAQALKQILLNPAMRFYLVRLINEFPDMILRWYQSLSDEDKREDDSFGIEALQVVLAGVVTMPTDLPFLPILVDKGIDLAFSKRGR
jgi:hypothetical protein